ncbi:hypothetical protein [Pelomonas cellulosilytica]|uniref:Membrane transporter protein n=1 Tax=Pelomonas cellulosilytica TaxID=2906762 RepID=A0ABS8XSV1_9BURK|nr:hypothetical protein [Pelomonas sp. P8]MCE4555782.1 hypothetical protein [Pelomonas sp. P8]
MARALLIVVLLIGLLGFGAMGLCGGIMTVAVVPAVFMRGGAQSLGLLVTSVPSAICGFFMARFFVNKLNALLARRTSRKDPA